MKSIYTLFFILLLASCTTKKSEKETSNRWAKLDGFHTVMADAFHPYKDSGNLVPAKELVNTLSDSAGVWAEATLPEKVNNQDMVNKLLNLKLSTVELLKMKIDNTPDSVFATQLTKVHDSFHEIQETWYKSGKKEEGEHKDH